MLNLDGSFNFGLTPTTWTNTGTISASGGATVNLAGNETVAQIGTLLHDASVTLNYTVGTLDNTGGTLDATSASLLNLRLAGGVIHGGAIDATGLGLTFTGSAFNGLDDVALVNGFTLNGGAVVLTGDTAIYADRGASTPGTLRINAGTVAFLGDGPFTLSSPVVLAGGNLAWESNSGTADVTIGAGVLVQGAGALIDNVFNSGRADNITNAGTIRANRVGETLSVTPTQLTNTGLMHATNGAVLSIERNQGRAWTNAAGGTISADSGATMWLGGPFSNAGTITAEGGTLNLDGSVNGSFTTWTNTGTIIARAEVVNIAGNLSVADIGNLTLINAQLNYTGGTLDNTGGTLDGDTASLFRMRLQGATIQGGTLDAGALNLGFSNSGTNVLHDVALINNFAVGNGAVVLDGSTAVYADAAATTPGLIAVVNGTLAFRGDGPFTLANPVFMAGGSLGWIDTNGTADVTIAGTSAVAGSGVIRDNIIGGAAADSVTNEGLLLGYIAGQALDVAVTHFTNDGTLRATGGGVVSVHAGTFTNLSGGTLTGGAYQVGAGSAISLSAPIVTDAASIVLDGPGSAMTGNGAAIETTLTSIAATGTLVLENGRNYTGTTALSNAGLIQLAGGTLTASSLTVGAGGTLFGYGVLQAAGGITDSGLISARFGTLSIVSAISGAGTIEIEGGATLALNQSASVTVDFAHAGGALQLANGGSLFSGTITDFSAGDSIALGGFTATGAIFAGGTLTISSLAGSVALHVDGGFAADAFNITLDAFGDSIVTLDDAPGITIATPAAAEAVAGGASALAGIVITDGAAATALVVVQSLHGALDLGSEAGTAVSGRGTTQLVLSGAIADLNAALATLTLAEANAGAEDRLSITVTDSLGETAGAVVSVAVDQPPRILAPTSAATSVGVAAPLPGISISDGDAVAAGETITVLVTATGGVLAATQSGSGTVIGGGTGTLTVTGSLAEVNAELASLTYAANDGTPGTVSVSVDDGRGGVAETAIATGPVEAPVLLMPAGATASAATHTPINGIYVMQGQSLGDSTPITLTLAGTTSILDVASNAAAVSGSGTSSLTITGTAHQINQVLSTLSFTGGSPGSTASVLDTITVTATEYGVSNTATLTVGNPVSGNPERPTYTAPIALIDVNKTGPLGSNVGGIYFNSDGSQGQSAFDLVGRIKLPTPGPGVPATERVAIAVYNPNDTAITVNALIEPNTPDAGLTFNAAEGGPIVVAPGATGYLFTESGSAAGATQQVIISSALVTGEALPDRQLTAEIGDGSLTRDPDYPGSPPTLPWPFGPLPPLPYPFRRLPPAALARPAPPLRRRHPRHRRRPADVAVRTAAPLPLSRSGHCRHSTPTPPPPLPPPPATTRHAAAPPHGGGFWGDVHLTTFDGLHYDFQAAGEFVLARSTVVGNAFEVQLRMEPWYSGASVSVATMTAIRIGAHTITVALDRAAAVWIDGSATSLPADGTAVDLGAGTIRQLSASTYQVDYFNGLSVSIANAGSYLNVNVSLPPDLAPGTVSGLLGNASGNIANAFTLPGGAVLQQPLSYDDLYTAWANAWRVSQATSLLDYQPGETTDTFTDLGFPAVTTQLSAFPADLVARAQALVAQAGITDPGVAQAAVEDFLLTGDIRFITGATNLPATTAILNTPTLDGTGGVGIASHDVKVVQAASGPTSVQFDIYRTGSLLADQVVHYAVLSPDGTYIPAADFAGGVLPSGQATIAAGNSLTTLTIDITGDIGTNPTQLLLVQIDSPSGGSVVLAPTATTVIANDAAVEGTPADPAFVKVTTVGSLVETVPNSYTLDLGQIAVGADGLFVLAVGNLGAGTADILSGSFTHSETGGLRTQGLTPITGLGGGQLSNFKLLVDTSTAGVFSGTITFAGQESNDSGFSAPVATITLEVQGAVVLPCFAAGTRIATPDGEVAIEALRAGDAVLTLGGTARPIRWIGRRMVDCARHAQPELVLPVRVMAGAFGPGVPSRDLILSPDHAVFVEAVLIPVKYLLNGTTVRQEEVARIHYFHVELDSHDVLLAEGLPAETFLDTGNRTAFANGGPVVDAFPDFAARVWDAAGCAPLVVTGKPVDRVRALLARHAKALMPRKRRRRRRA